MAVSQWPDKLRVLVLESSGVQAVAKFNVPEATQLQYMPLWLRRVGAGAGGSERFRLKVFGISDLTAPLATSGWVTLAGMTNMASQWLGWARFDFDRQNLYPGRPYYLGIEPDNYTRNGTTFYVSVLFDKNPFNVPIDEDGFAPTFNILGYK